MYGKADVTIMTLIWCKDYQFSPKFTKKINKNKIKNGHIKCENNYSYATNC